MMLTKLQTLPFPLRRYIVEQKHISEDAKFSTKTDKLANWLASVGVPDDDCFMGIVATSLGMWLRMGGDIITFNREQSGIVTKANENHRVTAESFRLLRGLESPRFIRCYHKLTHDTEPVACGLYVNRIPSTLLNEDLTDDLFVMGLEIPSEGMFDWFITYLSPDSNSPVGYSYRILERYVSGSFAGQEIGVNTGLLKAFTGLVTVFLAPVERQVVEYHVPKKPSKGRRRGMKARSYTRHHKVRRVDFETLTTRTRATMPTGETAVRSANANPGTYDGPGYFVGGYSRRQWVKEENARGERWLDIKEAKHGGYLVQVVRSCNKDGYHVGDYTTREERVRGTKELV
jgi:hypothetical protein